MAFTFNDSLSSNLDKVRFKIGDTDSTDQLLQDATINALLTEHNNDIELTAISCVRAIISTFNRTVDRNAAGMTANRSIIVQNYRDLLHDLLKQNRGNSGVRYKGSISRDRKETIEDDSDFIMPFSRTGQDDYPGTGPMERDPDDSDF